MDENETTGFEGETQVPATEVEKEVEDAPLDEEVDDTDEGLEEPQEEPTEEEAQPKGRASTRIANLARERAEAREEAKRAREEIDTLRAQMQAIQTQQTQQPSRAQEAEMLANMDPYERNQYFVDKQIREMQAQIQSVRMDSQDKTDRAEFMSKANVDPLRSKYADMVEKELATARAKGVNIAREELYYYVLGREVAKEKANGPRGAEQKVAKARVAATQGNTASIRGDVAVGSRGAKSLEDRLAGVYI
jgi:chromosome segregation ATPase